MELKDIQQDQNVVVKTEKIEDEFNNEENETDIENIVEENTTIDNKIEENITNIEDAEKNQDNENVENKTEESYNNPPTGDNVFVYGVVFVVAIIGIKKILR